MNDPEIRIFSVMLKEADLKIKAVKYCLYDDVSTPPDDILDYLPIYQGGDKNFLQSMLNTLIQDKHALNHVAPLESRLSSYSQVVLNQFSPDSYVAK